MSEPSMTTYCNATGPAILIVEGKDDCHGIFHFASRCGLTETFGIWAGENDDQALKQFGGLLAARSGVRPNMLGLVIDCDTSEHTDGDPLTRRWQQIAHRLKDYGYDLPEKPAPGGTILIPTSTGDLPKLGLWVMPDNSSQGMFEDFLMELVSPDTKAHAEQVVTEAARLGHADFKEVHRSKAVAHTVLAWKDEPGRPIGIAMKMGSFNINTPVAQSFKAWLSALFSTSNALTIGDATEAQL